MHRAVATAVALLLVGVGCGEGDGLIGQGGTDLESPAITAPAVPTSAPPTAPATAPATQAVTVAAPVLGIWVQDDTGLALTYRRRFEFRPDGSYQFLFTSRPTGSSTEQVLTVESGRYSVSGDRLSLSPAASPPSQLGWRIDPDPIGRGERLSLTMPDGTSGIFYRPS